MGQPAHRFLEEFPSEIVTTPTSLSGLRSRGVELPSPPPPDPVTTQLAEAYERGLAEGRVMERGLADAELAKVSLEYELKLEDVRRNFSEALIERLAVELRDGIARERASLDAQLAGVLAPVLMRVISETAIREFSSEFGQLLGANDDVLAELTGPEALLARVTLRIGQLPGADAEWTRRIRLVPSESIEVRAQVGDSMLEMRLKEWLQTVEEAMT